MSWVVAGCVVGEVVVGFQRGFRFFFFLLFSTSSLWNHPPNRPAQPRHCEAFLRKLPCDAIERSI